MVGAHWSGNLVRRVLASGFLALGILPFAVTSSGADEKLKPPGDCTAEDHAKLQAEVDNSCKQTKEQRENDERPRCLESDSCDTLIDKKKRFKACMVARATINVKCFRGGDDGHQKALEAAAGGVNRCNERIAARQCKEPPECK